MKFMDKVWGSLGLMEPVEMDEEEKQKIEEVAEPKGKRSSNLVNLPTVQPKQVKVMIVEPFAFDDAQNVADHLKNRKPVVVNLENTDREVAKRIIDFISGTTYAILMLRIVHAVKKARKICSHPGIISSHIS